MIAKDAENQGNTVAEMIDLDMEATAFCHACSRYRPLDLAALSKTRGPDMPIRRGALRLCENCGAPRLRRAAAQGDPRRAVELTIPARPIA